MTSDNVDLGSAPGDWFPRGVATVRIRATSSAPIFVGIGSRSLVEQYLRGVAHDVVTDVRFTPFEATYSHVGGSTAPSAPGDASFWVAKASGPGDRTLRWDVERGNWVVVLMNADGTVSASTPGSPWPRRAPCCCRSGWVCWSSACSSVPARPG